MGLRHELLRPLALALSVGGIVVAGCGGDGESGEASGISVDGTEYAFEMPDSGDAGVVRFDVANTGGELHEFALTRLDEGRTQEDVEAYLKSGKTSEPSWVEDVGGVPLLSPGEDLSITRELDPGTYTFLCFIPNPEGVPHVNLGMIKTFELEGDSGQDPPEADAVITANANGYEIPQIEAGSQTVELRNDDTRDREFFLIALKPGKSVADIDRFFQQGEDKAEPPADFLGAMQTIPPGTSVFLERDFEAGVEYTLADNSGPEPVLATFTPE